MIFISEALSAAAVTRSLAFDAVRRALIAAIAPEATSFPVVLGHASNPQNRFTIKSAAGATLAGLKIGSYPRFRALPRSSNARVDGAERQAWRAVPYQAAAGVLAEFLPVQSLKRFTPLRHRTLAIIKGSDEKENLRVFHEKFDTRE